MRQKWRERNQVVALFVATPIPTTIVLMGASTSGASVAIAAIATATSTTISIARISGPRNAWCWRSWSRRAVRSVGIRISIGIDARDASPTTMPQWVHPIDGIIPRIGIPVDIHARDGRVPGVGGEEAAEVGVVVAGVEILQARFGIEAFVDVAPAIGHREAVVV